MPDRPSEFSDSGFSPKIALLIPDSFFRMLSLTLNCFLTRFWASSLLFVGIAFAAAAEVAPANPIRIMAVGDSITEGSDKFSCYRPLLSQRLAAAGYQVEFV